MLILGSSDHSKGRCPPLPGILVTMQTHSGLRGHGAELESYPATVEEVLRTTWMRSYTACLQGRGQLPWLLWT